MKSSLRIVLLSVGVTAVGLGGAVTLSKPLVAQQVPPFEEMKPTAQLGDQRDYIPKEYGRLVSVTGEFQSSGVGSGWMWFEDASGTVRIVYVGLRGKDNYVWNVVKTFPRR